MLIIDSQIWIYYLDINAEEHPNVLHYLETVLDSEKILFCQ